MTTSTRQATTDDLKGNIKIEPTILKKAKFNEPESIALMFRQFIPDEENIFFVQYLGIKGIWGIGASSFVCLTDRRVADITVGFFGEVTYEDVYLESITSGFIDQPSRIYLFLLTLINGLLVLGLIVSVLSAWMLFLWKFILILLKLLGAIILHYLMVRIYYGIVKCGIRFFGNIPAFPSIYIFANRKLLRRADRLCRELAFRRELRLDSLKEIKKSN